MNEKTGMPIFFIHFGGKNFLDIALRQATLAAPNSEIILITDEIRELALDVKQVLYTDYCDSFNEFKKIYRHVSVNMPNYELICYGRWFFLKDYLAKNPVERFAVFDSDIMLYQPPEAFAADIGDHWACNAAWANCFSSPQVVNLLCDYFCQVFADEARLNAMAQKYAVNGTPHLSDMYLLVELADATPEIIRVSEIRHLGFDGNIQYSEGYAMAGGCKELAWGPGRIPQGRWLETGATVPFKFLHFQGPVSKKMMHQVAWEQRPD
jgi:hypothetical protein